MKTLFLSPPSFEGFDGGAGARYQARREIRSFWYPTWLAQPAALVPNSKLMDCPPHDIDVKNCLAEAKNFENVVIHTSTPSLKNDCKVAEAIKAQRPGTLVGFVGAHTAVLPEETLKASTAIDWVGRKEFDYTCLEVSEGRPFSDIQGLSYRNKEGKIVHNPERELIPDMDALPWVTDVYKRDLTIEKYSIGYLKEPYVSLYTGADVRPNAHFVSGLKPLADIVIVCAQRRMWPMRLLTPKNCFPRPKSFSLMTTLLPPIPPGRGKLPNCSSRSMSYGPATAGPMSPTRRSSR